MAIEEIPVRAKILVGSLVIETPYVYSFNVNRQRANPSTMSATLKVKGEDIVSGSSGTVKVQAGVRGELDTIFTGDLYNIRMSPCWDDPSYVMLNIEAKDVLARLIETKFTRRQSSSDIMYALITSADNSYKGGKFNTITEATKFEMPAEASTSSVGGQFFSGQGIGTGTKQDPEFTGEDATVGVTINVPN